MTLSRRRVAIATALAGALAIGAMALVTVAPADAATCQVAAAGDIGESGGNQSHTGDQIRAAAPQFVLPLGDEAYDSGTTAEFAANYNPFWGSFKSITRPTPGNHEYETAGAAGYFAYFAGQVGTSAYYAFDVCGWRLYSMNSELTGGARTTMLSWFTADVASHPGQPRLGYWHKPRYNDGTSHGDDTGQQDLWAAMTAAGVKVVLNGHEHSYQRWAEMNSSGVATAGGTREFIVGTGGATLNDFGSTIRANDQKHVTGSHGAMVLTLRANGYDWKWADWDGSVSDTGSLNWTVATPTTTPPITSTTSPVTTTPPVTSTTPPATTTACPPAATVTVTATQTVTATAAAATVTKSIGFAPPTTVTPVVVAPAVTVTPTVLG